MRATSAANTSCAAAAATRAEVGGKSPCEWPCESRSRNFLPARLCCSSLLLDRLTGCRFQLDHSTECFDQAERLKPGFGPLSVLSRVLFDRSVRSTRVTYNQHRFLLKPHG